MNIPDSLQRRHEAWIEAVNNKNIEAYANLLTEDVVWIPPDQKPIMGRKAFKQWLAPFFSKFSYKFLITEERFILAGRWAFERAKFTSE